MAIIIYPVLEFKDSLSAFLNYAREYNTEKSLRDQLRPQHVKIYTRILTLLSRQIYEHNDLFSDTPQLRKIDSKEPIRLSTNRKALSWVDNTIKVNENTAYRQVNRLIESGVIVKKINHGSQMNFELFINPEILLISDLVNPNYKPQSNFLKTENKAVSKGLNTSCPAEYSIEKEHINNLNITVDNVSSLRRDVIVKEPKKNIEKEHGEIAINRIESMGHNRKLITQWNLSAKKHEEKEHYSAPAPETELRKHQKAAARWFFWYVMDMLFKNRTFNTAHLENTINYVEQNYFTKCFSLEAIEKTKKLYQWRIDKVKRTIERNNLKSN